MREFVCRHRTVVAVLSLAVSVCFFAQISSASVVAVSGGANCTNLPFYPTITQAINSVPANSTIKICPGTYHEQLLITKNLTLTGVSDGTGTGTTGVNAVGADNPVIASPVGGVVQNTTEVDGSPTAAQIAIVTPNGAVSPIMVHLNYLTVDGANNQINTCGLDLVGIYAKNATIFVVQSVARNQLPPPGFEGCQSGLGIFSENGASYGVTSTIQNNSVHGYAKNGITVKGALNSAVIMGNYVVGMGATPLVAQNGIELGGGANGRIQTNTVTDDVYVNPADCLPNSCYGSSGILIYDSGAVFGNHLIVTGNTVSNTQFAVVAFPFEGTADYNDVSMNKITTTLNAGPYLDDAIDLCSNHNTATSNTVFNSAGAGVHIDSLCTEGGNPTGNDTTVTRNTINEACAGVLTGTGASPAPSLNIFYNVGQTTFAGDSCPAPAAARARPRLRPSPKR